MANCFIDAAHNKNRWYIVFVSTLVALFFGSLDSHLVMNDATIERMYNGLDTRADALMVGCTLGVLTSSFTENIKEYLSKYLMVIAPFL